MSDGQTSHSGPHDEIAALRARVAELESAAEELRQSESRYVTLTEGLREGIYTSRQGVFTSVNKAMCDMFGYDRSKLVGIPAWTLAKPELQGRAKAEFFAMAESGAFRPIEIECVRKDGSAFVAEVHISGVMDNGEVHGIVLDISEWKQTQAALLESEEQYRSLVENVNVGVYRNTGGPRGRFLKANLAMARIFGYDSVEDVMQVNVSDLYQDPADRATFIQEIAHAGLVKDKELRLRKKDGTPIWASVTARVERTQDGQIRWMDGVIEDITERKQAETALRESEATARALLNAPTDFASLITPDGTILGANETLARRLGRTVEDMIGANIWRLFPPEASEYRRERVRQVVETRKPVRFEDSRAGRHFDSIFSPILDAAGNVTKVATMARDITERKQAEEAIRASEARYRHLLESLRDAYASIDMEGRIGDFNQAFTDMLGYSPEEVRGLTYRDITPENWHDSEALILEEQVMTRGYSDVYEKEYRRKDGTVFPIEIRTFLIRDETGTPAGMWAIIRDITERRRLERTILEIGERERRTIGYNLHDDLGQHLTGLRLLCDVLARDLETRSPEDAPRAEELGRLARESIAKVRTLVKGLSLVEPGPEGLSMALERLADAMTNQPAGIRVSFERDGDAHVPNRDVANHLHRIAQEAVNNAVRHAEARNIRIELSARRKTVRLCVHDDGKGLPPDNETAEGMGLKIMQFRARMVGGVLEVASSPAEGTRICCSCPNPPAGNNSAE